MCVLLLTACSGNTPRVGFPYNTVYTFQTAPIKPIISNSINPDNNLPIYQFSGTQAVSEDSNGAWNVTSFSTINNVSLPSSALLGYESSVYQVNDSGNQLIRINPFTAVISSFSFASSSTYIYALPESPASSLYYAYESNPAVNQVDSCLIQTVSGLLCTPTASQSQPSPRSVEKITVFQILNKVWYSGYQRTIYSINLSTGITNQYNFSLPNNLALQNFVPDRTDSTLFYLYMQQQGTANTSIWKCYTTTLSCTMRYSNLIPGGFEAFTPDFFATDGKYLYLSHVLATFNLNNKPAVVYSIAQLEK